MSKVKDMLLGASAMVVMSASSVYATDVEVAHWWTSGGEAAAVAEMAKAFNAQTNDKWVDGAIAGSGPTARPIIVSRILGGDPMAATQFNHGRQAEELIEAGLMQDITDVAEAEGWFDKVNPKSLLEACTFEGKVYCAPINIHSWQWLWLSNEAFEKAGVAMPKNWDEFVAAGPKLEAAGIVPLAVGNQAWQQMGAFNILTVGVGGTDLWNKVNAEKDVDVAAGPEMAKVFKAMADARALSANSKVQDWNQATNMVITGKAGGQMMGDWAQGEFKQAGKTAGVDYSCLPGLGINKVVDLGGDAFYFPKNKDPEVTRAQKELAKVILSPKVQVAFNLVKGSLPVRGDVDLQAANDCMRKGLEILGEGKIVSGLEMVQSPDTLTNLQDLITEFWTDPSMTPEAAQARYVDLIAEAE